ncbi:GNAT family N-acetyltransferase [Flavobacteriaceae bacterium 3-367]
MNIRSATLQDKEKIIELVKTGLKEFGFEYSSTTSELDLEDFAEVYLNIENTFLIMETSQGKLAATGALLKERNHDSYKIQKMYVSKMYRGLGYGKLMLEQFIQLAKSNKAQTILLETSNHMKTAIGLYKSYGFKETCVIPKSPRYNITMTK